jgi:hypothetical protein
MILTLIANRILWAKVINVGQTSAAVDTLFCTLEMAKALIPKLIHSLRIQLGTDEVLSWSVNNSYSITNSCKDRENIGGV